MNRLPVSPISDHGHLLVGAQQSDVVVSGELVDEAVQMLRR